MKRLFALLIIASFMLSLVSCLKNEPASIGKKDTKIPDAPTVNLKNEPASIGKKDTKIPDAPTVNIEVLPEVDPSSSPEEAVTDMAVDILKSLYKGDENLLISPASISLALGLTAGGAKGETFTQFEKLLGRGVPMSEMNAFYKALAERLDESEKVDINVANSVWIRDGKDVMNVEKSFLDFADEVFDAEVFRKPFDRSTVSDINEWVDDNTDGMIKQIIDEISSDTVMYLINALAFEGDWQRAYTDTSDYFKFTNCAGETETVTGMFSSESQYLEDENTVGFIKNYKGGEYGFAVFLPDENVSINDYVASLSGDKLNSMLSNAETCPVEATLPKFTFEYSSSLNDTLKAMGLTSAFSDEADLTGLGTSSLGHLYISEVLHKTFIEVAEKGTRAAAVTSVAVNTESVAIVPDNTKYVVVNRPFVFAIIDNTSRVPLFLGVTLSVD